MITAYLLNENVLIMDVTDFSDFEWISKQPNGYEIAKSSTFGPLSRGKNPVSRL